MKKTTTSAIALAAPLTLGVSMVWGDNSSSQWDLLASIEIEEIITDTSYEVRKTFPSEVENGVGLRVTSDDPAVVARITGLGFFGLMASQDHHREHHLMMALGEDAHAH